VICIGKNIWVVKHPEGWAVKSEGNKRATNVTKTQREAIEIGREFAKKHASELIIQSREGKIRSKDSYGNDPNPPKDTEH